MSYTIALKHFQGPLDVLLELIDQEKLEINSISLGTITDQYLSYIANRNIPAEELSDFLTIAVKLVLLKTRSLLPYLEETEEEDEIQLEKQLKIYYVYWKAAKTINEYAKSKRRSFSMAKSPLMDRVIFSPPKKTTTSHLKQAMRTLVEAISPLMDIPKTSIKKTVSLSQKIATLRSLLSQPNKCTFYQFIVRDGRNRTDIIVNFLAILELIKQNELAIAGVDRHAELTLMKTS